MSVKLRPVGTLEQLQARRGFSTAPLVNGLQGSLSCATTLSLLCRSFPDHRIPHVQLPQESRSIARVFFDRQVKRQIIQLST